MTWKQTLAVILGVSLVAAVVCWFLEGFNRQRLIDDFRKQLAEYPEFRKKEGA